MSKRVTLTDFEVEQLINGLETLRNEISLGYQVVKVGQNFYDQLITKLKSQHPRSVKTLDVSGNGDDKSIPQKAKP